MKKVLKLALEALELMYACYAHPEWISHKQQEEKILAQCVATTMTLRQAIAEAEKQEPVAITITGKLGNIYSFTGDYSLKKGDKVYTTPPQRKPLTHEQRFDLLTKFEPHKNKWEAPAILIDMVEAAHGIKE